MHDELMIDWGRTPVGSVATLYLPAVSSESVLDLAAQMYRTSNLVLIDEHTLQTRTGGMSRIPIPKGGEMNFTGMITIDLPPTVRAGQAFTVIVRAAGDRCCSNRHGRGVIGAPLVTHPRQFSDHDSGTIERAHSRAGTAPAVEPALDRTGDPVDRSLVPGVPPLRRSSRVARRRARRRLEQGRAVTLRRLAAANADQCDLQVARIDDRGPAGDARHPRRDHRCRASRSRPVRARAPVRCWRLNNCAQIWRQ